MARHIGRVEAIVNSAIIRVRWEDSGWISEFVLRHAELENLTRFKRRNEPTMKAKAESGSRLSSRSAACWPLPAR